MFNVSAAGASSWLLPLLAPPPAGSSSSWLLLLLLMKMTLGCFGGAVMSAPHWSPVLIPNFSTSSSTSSSSPCSCSFTAITSSSALPLSLSPLRASLNLRGESCQTDRWMDGQTGGCSDRQTSLTADLRDKLGQPSVLNYTSVETKQHLPPGRAAPPLQTPAPPLSSTYSHLLSPAPPLPSLCFQSVG